MQNVGESNDRLVTAAHLQFIVAGVTAQQPAGRQGRHCHAELKGHNVVISLPVPLICCRTPCDSPELRVYLSVTPA